MLAMFSQCHPHTRCLVSMEKQINEEFVTAGSSMHCSIRGWVFAFMVAERCHQAAGGGTIPVGPVNHDRGLREAFVRYPLSEATRGLNKRTGHRTCNVLEGTSRRGSEILRAKKNSRDSDVEDFRWAWQSPGTFWFIVRVCPTYCIHTLVTKTL